MPFCPQCRDEYVAGSMICPDCDCELVQDLSEIPEPSPPEAPPDNTPVGVVAHMIDEDGAVARIGLLRGVGIPARSGERTDDGIPIEVPTEFESQAQALLKRLQAQDAADVREDDLTLLEESIAVTRRRPEDEAVGGLMRILVRGQGDLVTQAASRLTRIGDAGLAALLWALIDAVRMDAFEVRTAAVKALVQSGCTEAPKELIALTGDESAEVRVRAIRTLASLASPLAVVLLRDPEESVREEAADALWELSGGGVNLDLDAEPDVVENAIRRLEDLYAAPSRGVADADASDREARRLQS
jgi:HEAT repeat protein